MNNRSLARLLLPIAILLSILYGSCRKITPTWFPYIDTVTLNSGGTDRTIHMSETSIIPVLYGQPLKVVSIGGVLAMADRRWVLGPVVRISDIPRPPWQPGDLEMRIVVFIRKHSLGPRADCFDLKDILQTEWIPVPIGRWSVQLPGHEWMTGSEWEAVKIVIYLRNHGNDHVVSPLSPGGGAYILDFSAPEGSSGLRKRVGTSIFGTITREFQKCP